MAGEQKTTSPVERVLDTGADPRRLSSRSRQYQRSLEHYLAGGLKPRWMQRIIDIDRGIAEQRRELERSYRSIRQAYGEDQFAAHWRERVARWRFDELNRLIAQHNEYYPIERDLPMNPRTGEYITAGGRPFRRQALDADWVFAQFPAG